MSAGIAVTVSFAPGFPSAQEGPALLAFEKHLRLLTGADIRVFKERMGDDSKLRVLMSKSERDSL